MVQPRSLRAARMPSLLIVESAPLLLLGVASVPFDRLIVLELLLSSAALGNALPVLSGAVVVLGAVLVELLGEVDMLCDGAVDGVGLELSVVDWA